MIALLRFLLVIFLIVAISGCKRDTQAASENDSGPRRIEILFLGHEAEHHNSRAYLPILASALTRQGINLTYTEKVSDLNKDYLENFDGVLIYANHEGRHPKQEKALLDYIAEGHAFIPIHCASFCFKESEDYINLVGGQFTEHDTATFTTRILKNDHPVMQGLEEFATWDETYVHHKLADDREVLMERGEGEGAEPWTWVRNHGKGKVFYTAYGHDARTWNQPGFQELVANGIIWAVDDEVRRQWEEYRKDIPTLVYEDRADIPNYEKRDPAPRYQLPLSAEASAKLIQVPPGFALELFASEPDIINPIAMNWDERGRLWVIETVDYPNTVRDDKGAGDDRIKICEDTDGDGKADTFTIFADGLNIPTSFAFWNGGVMVSQAPDFLFLKDTDGDDRADLKEVVIEGWGTFDTHAGPSNLQVGLDNNLYGVVGYSGFKGNIFGTEREFRQGIYRFDPQSRYFEFLTNTSNNTWGLGITEDNSLFASTANNTHSVFMGLPNASIAELEGIAARGSRKIDGHYAMQPITRNVRQVDVFGGFTAASGHHFYTARAYPEEYWNRVALVCEPTGGLVHRAIIEPDGAGYLERDGGNLFASSDEWVSPVEAKVGPDGAVWIADWYNFIVQHNPTPSEERGGYNAENGEGNAYINPLRDRSHGRIWRVVYRNADAMDPLTLSREEPGELLSNLNNDNMFWRMTAQRLLVEQKDSSVIPDLYRLVNDDGKDGKGLNAGALHGLWTLEGMGALSGEEGRALVRGALYHPSPSVRRAAIRLLPSDEDGVSALLKSGMLQDKSPGVQLEALTYLSLQQASAGAGEALYALSQRPEIQRDSWLSLGVYAAARAHASGFLRAFVSANPGFRGAVETPVEGEPAPLEGKDLAETFATNYMNRVDMNTDTSATSTGPALRVTIRTIPNEMKYDVTEFVVAAGQAVELVFENNDFMQHNVVVVQAGQKEKVGLAADKLATDPSGVEQDYIPAMPEVLYATAIVDPEKEVVLRFTAPAVPGNYPYICTFPGHWRIMQGIMKVVPAR